MCKAWLNSRTARLPGLSGTRPSREHTPKVRAAAPQVSAARPRGRPCAILPKLLLSDTAMEDRSSRYCIIGAGPFGLCMARALQKAGIPYEQLEADADVGGNWRHGVYSTAHIISSRR